MAPAFACLLANDKNKNRTLSSNTTNWIKSGHWKNAFLIAGNQTVFNEIFLSRYQEDDGSYDGVYKHLQYYSLLEQSYRYCKRAALLERKLFGQNRRIDKELK